MRGVLTHWLLPHHSNNHRAKALHIYPLLAYAFLIFVLNIGIRILPRQYPQILGFATDIYVEKLLEYTNAKRQKAGLASLEFNTQLSIAAAEKAKDMFAGNYWAHTSPTGKTPWDFIIKSGYSYTVAGENLAKNFMDSKGVVDAWMNSSSHRDNLLKQTYKDIGFAVVNGVLNGEETTLVVQMFGSKTGPITYAGNIVNLQDQVQKTIKSLQVVPTESPIQVLEKESKPVILTDEAIQTESKYLGNTINAQQIPFIRVLNQPLFHIPQVSIIVAYIVIGFLLVVFMVDALIIARRKTVRVVGYTMGHMMFLSTILIIVSIVKTGVIL